MASDRAKAARYAASPHGSARLLAKRTTPEAKLAAVAYTKAWRKASTRYADWQRAYRDTEEGRAARVHQEGRRRARGKRLDLGDVTREALATIRAMPCAYCMGPGGTVDHGYPLALGGLHALDNLVPSCKPCNSQKRMAADWW